MTIGERMKFIRQRNNMTLQDVGDKIGISRATIKRWEDGSIMNMGADKLELVAGALGVTPAFLMGWEDENGNLIYKSNPDPKEEKIQEIMALAAKLPPEKLALAESLLKALAENH